MTLQAGNTLNATAAQLTSVQGNITLTAGQDVNLSAGQAQVQVDEAHQHKSRSNPLSSTTITTRDTLNQTTAQASVLSGQRVTVRADQNIHLTGSQVLSDHNTTLVAQGNLTMAAAHNSTIESHEKDEKKSGVFSGGGLGITIGTRQQSTDQQNTRTSASASTVGSIKGDVNLSAGKAYQQTGSDVMAPAGNVTIQAQSVTIEEARETSQSATEQKFKQTGISIGISNPLISAAQTAQSMGQAAGNTSDPRMQALAAVAAGLTAKNAYDAVSADPKALGGLNISITLGSSKSQSLQQSSSDTARSSTVAAGGTVDIAAVGAGAASDVLIRGSTVQAGDSVKLSADHNINLSAAANTSQQSRSSSANSAGVGVAISVGSNGTGAGFTANASASRGSGNGQDTRWTNTQITGGQAVNLQSGADTTLKGAVVSANTVQADVGGNLNIQSLQDSSSYNSKDQSVGGSVTVGAGFAGSLNIGQQRINSNFASVTAQSGIQAGDGGFQVSVGNNTDLKGAVIASTQVAVDGNKNTFSTGTLTTSAIQNTAEYSASSFSIGGGYSDGKGLLPIGGGASSAGAGSAAGIGTDSKGNAQTGAAQTPGSTLPGYNGFSATVPLALSASGSASSTTASGISAAAIRITDSAGQQALTGQTADQAVATLDSSVRSGVDTSHALQPIFNESEIKARFEIVGILSRETGTFLANRAQESMQIKAELAQETAKPPEQQDPDKINQLSQSLADRKTWEMGGMGRILLTAFTSAAGANVMGSTTAVVQGAAANYLQSLATEQVKFIADTLSSEPARAALQGIVACGGAALQSQNCAAGAAGAASSVVLNNLMDGLTGSQASTLTPEQKQARENIITSLIAGTATLIGGEAAIATIAARIETENNAANFVRGTTERIRTVATSAADVLGKPKGTLTRADIDAQLSRLNAVGAQGNLSVQESLNLSSLWMGVIERAAVEGLMTPSEIVGSKQFMQSAIASMAFSGGGNGPLSQNTRTSTTGPVLPRTSSPFVAQGGVNGGTTAKPLFGNMYPEHVIDPAKIVPTERLSGISGNFNYVITEQGTLIVGRSGHTSLTGGAPVQAAGELQLYNGNVKWIDNASGHYQPSSNIGSVAETAFNNAGLDATGKFVPKVWVPNLTLPRGGSWVKTN